MRFFIIDDQMREVIQSSFKSVLAKLIKYWTCLLSDNENGSIKITLMSLIKILDNFG